MAVSTQEVWAAFRTRLKGFILKRLPDEEEAEDILQEVFLKIHARLHTLKEEEKLEAWVFQITRNAITEHYRARQKGKAAAGTPLEEIEALASDETPQQYIEAQEEDAGRLIQSCLAPMIETLSSADQEALRLTEIEQVTQKEMSERLHISFSGAKSRVQRARERLKNVVFECCHLEFDRRGNIIDYTLRTEDCRFCSPHPSKKNSSS